MAEPRAFNYGDFSLGLVGDETKGCQVTPTARFLPSSPDAKRQGISFSGFYKSDMMDNNSYFQALSYDEFRYFLNVLRLLANAPVGEAIVQQLPLKYFKGGEFHYSGCVIGLVKEVNGEIFFAFKNKGIPTVKFRMRMAGSMEHQDKDREALPVDVTTKLAVETITARWEAMLNDAISTAVREGGTGKASGGNGGGGNSKPAPSPAGGEDFDDDIPF